jgi:hypothetical protein
MVLCCPICGAITTWEGNPTRPFCSKACQQRDLGNWLNERYSLPIDDDELSPGTETEPLLEEETG